MVSVAVAVTVRDVIATALIDGTGAVADATGVQRTDAIIDVVADAIAVGIGRTGSTTDAEGVGLVSVAVAVTVRDVFATALIDCSWSSTNTAFIEHSEAIIFVITNAVAIRICELNGTTCAKFTGVICKQTRGVIEGGFLVKIAGKAVRATSNGKVQIQIYRTANVVAFQEDLRVDVACKHAVGGELGNEDPQVGSGNSIGCAGQNKPPSAGEV